MGTTVFLQVGITLEVLPAKQVSIHQRCPQEAFCSSNHTSMGSGQDDEAGETWSIPVTSPKVQTAVLPGSDGDEKVGSWAPWRGAEGQAWQQRRREGGRRRGW